MGDSIRFNLSFDPKFKQVIQISAGQQEIRGYFIFQAVKGGHTGSGGFKCQLLIEIAVIIIEELRGVIDTVVYFVGTRQVLIKSIEEIEMVKVPEVQLREIPMEEMYVFQGKDAFGLIGMPQEVLSLLYPEIVGLWPEMGRCQAELAGPASNVQYPGIPVDRQKGGCLARYSQGLEASAWICRG